MMINPETVIGDMLKDHPGTSAILTEAGMPCLGCPTSMRENIEQACFVHGIDVEPLLDKLNGYLKDSENETV